MNEFLEQNIIYVSKLNRQKCLLISYVTLHEWCFEYLSQ